MIVLECPGCGLRHEVISGHAYHECPKRRNRIVEFREVDDDDERKAQA